MGMPPRFAMLAVWLAAALPAAVVAQQGAVVPPPAGARSLEVETDGAPVVLEPREGAERRGTVGEGTRLPLGERLYGEGCAEGVWYRIGEHAHICQEHVRYSAEPPGGAPVLQVPPGEVLPQRYAFVRWDAARAFAHPSHYFADDYREAFGKGFGLVVTGRSTYEGVPFARTRSGLWIQRDALRWARGSRFQGVELDDSEGEALDMGWVLAEGAPVREKPAGRVTRRAGRREVVRVSDARGRWLRLRDGGWMRARRVARATGAEPPEQVENGDRWVDVDLGEQVMVAYEGRRPVYATLVSTGRRLRTHRTPKGTFRTWVKLAYSDMDDLEREDVSRNYMIEQVPWVQYFEGAIGFHAAFWHDDFGRRRSHGCVNLAPRDARWLFDFTRPELPEGWQAILPTERNPGTVVRVR
ncbi:MAG: L,D-transpeptidase [Myxococcota bacterium]